MSSGKHADDLCLDQVVFLDRGQQQSGGPRIALLTPYNGGNLGDGAIQDAMIANIRSRRPDAKFSGITLNRDAFTRLHGGSGFPLCATPRRFYGMSGETVALSNERESQASGQLGQAWNQLKCWIEGIVLTLSKTLRFSTLVVGPLRELRHCIEAYHFLRTKDLVIVSGGGQLDEEWGGPWGHPYALFKWAVLAHIASVPYAMASVGAQKVRSTASRFFLSKALGLAAYRSYRNKNTKDLATSLFPGAIWDAIVPDLAFSLSQSELPSRVHIRRLAKERLVVAISPIAYAKPGNWPFSDSAIYNRYLQNLSRVASELLKRGCFLVIVYSSIGDDEAVIPELLGHLKGEWEGDLTQQIYVPSIASWKDFVAALREVDVLIASRLHSTILGWLVQTPTIAISFDPKVNQQMEDLGQTDYLLQIENFRTADVIEAFDRIRMFRRTVEDEITAYRDRVYPALAHQYDALMALLRNN
jgi:polysaccharide pyruvyl transferase WcaK-like protein